MVFAVALTFIAGCKIQTPEIRGVVLDAETKEPVADAWVASVTISVDTRTVAGNVGRIISLEPPHLRTGKDGRFVIPSRAWKKPPPPIGFGTKVVEFEIGAGTIDKSGSLKINPDELGKNKIDVRVYIEDIEKIYKRMWGHLSHEEFEYEKEESIFSGLHGLYRYCTSGRSSIEVYIEESPTGCDDWEFNYAITKYEWYLEKYKNPQINTGTLDRLQDRYDRISHYSLTLEHLAYLYKEKGEYKKALDTFHKSLEFSKKWNTFNRKAIEYQINELKQLQQKQQPQP